MDSRWGLTDETGQKSLWTMMIADDTVIYRVRSRRKRSWKSGGVLWREEEWK